jgi:hypothetical protein
MGGLIIRYALAQVERNRPRFPRYLLKYRQSNDPAVGHMTMLGLGSARTTAYVERWTRPGPWRVDLTSHWPIRRADLAVTFGNR